MPLEKLEIEGLRGFSSAQSMRFATPNGTPGSGLTMLTGANNSGKSTIIEALRARAGHQPPSFTTGARNKGVDSVRITYTIDGQTEEIRSITKGGSETTRESKVPGLQVFVLPSRRAFNPFFGKNVYTRDQYIGSHGLPPLRTSILQNFEYRLFNILKAPEAFNQVVAKVLPFEPKWTIDQSDQGQYYLKFDFGGSSHTSDGMGDGIVSIFCIVDSLYDSKAGDAIVIDEPELSLHPALQKRLMTLLVEYTKDRQIVISTHSPYFVDIRAIVDGAHLVRVKNKGTGIRIHELTPQSVDLIKGLALDNLYNPHTFGLNGRELFFIEDRVILVEGQEDVLLYPRIAEQIGLSFDGEFFGWGVGGADNMPRLCQVLAELGFERVVALLDANQTRRLDSLRAAFPDYHFDCIPADDVRTKPPKEGRPVIDGLVDAEGKLRGQHRACLMALIGKINTYLQSEALAGCTI